MADNPKPSEAQRQATQGEKAVSDAAATVSQTADRISDSGRQTLERTRQDAARFASRGLDIGSQAVDAYVEAGKRASERLSEANRALTETCSRQLADYSDLSQRAVNCRTIEDIVGLQNEALQRMKGQFDAATRVYGLFIDAFADSLQPIADSAAQARGRFQQAA
ncbi:MAG: hypothetical protein JF615_02940 [Asticcacaulis sp.]|nr:hypothetical protein [Asticcacaulis sp.]